MGISAADLAKGFLPDPTSKSKLRILGRPGLVLRLTRNLDKQRGFVNGALAVVCESLEGNAVLICRLIGTGNHVLAHPMEEDGATFLPCCYGYATTIRRAQGASLTLGCIFFDQRRSRRARLWVRGGISVQVSRRLLSLRQATYRRLFASWDRARGRGIAKGCRVGDH